MCMLFSNGIECPAPPRLRRRIEYLECGARVVLDAQPAEGSRLGIACLSGRREMVVHGDGVGGEEFLAPERRPHPNLSPARHPHIDADIAVPVSIFDQVPKSKLHRFPRHASTSSQGFRLSRSGSASKAWSRANLSQTVRVLMSLGPGILPSLTIASNMLGLTPMYAAASARHIPRGGYGKSLISSATGSQGSLDSSPPRWCPSDGPGDVRLPEAAGAAGHLKSSRLSPGGLRAGRRSRKASKAQGSAAAGSDARASGSGTSKGATSGRRGPFPQVAPFGVGWPSSGGKRQNHPSRSPALSATTPSFLRARFSVRDEMPRARACSSHSFAATLAAPSLSRRNSTASSRGLLSLFVPSVARSASSADMVTGSSSQTTDEAIMILPGSPTIRCSSLKAKPLPSGAR